MQTESLGRASQDMADSLRRKILSNELASGQFLPSVRALCGRHGLALATVGKALRSLKDEGMIVAEPRRGYRVASRDRFGTKYAPLACVMDIAGEQTHWPTFVQSMVSMSQAQALRYNRSLLVVNAYGQPSAEVLNQLRAARVGGVLLDSENPALLGALADSGIPTVLCERWQLGTPFDSVVQDDFGGGMLAAKYLTDQGHDRIGWLGWKRAGGIPRIAARFGGVLAGLAQAGLPLRPEWYVDLPDNNPTAAEVDQVTRQFLSRPDRPTAILALWGDASQSLARVAKELGLVPGRDFDLVAWTSEEAFEETHRNWFSGGYLPPAMTWSVAELAKVAVSRLEDRLVTRDLPPLTIRIPVGLRVSHAESRGSREQTVATNKQR